MEKRTTALARVLAAIALVGARRRRHRRGLDLARRRRLGRLERARRAGETARHRRSSRSRRSPATYVVKNGDTLTSIAHKTGVSVVRIQTLNPEVDPQILISGETLKLR